MSTPASAIVPAQLSFLAIYNPQLGPTDDTFRDQVVFWWSRAAKEARRKDGGGSGTKLTEEEENEKLRQIGLAQGMIDFAKSFANKQPVDAIDTEKSRIVLHELENDWWVLASIQLTRIPIQATTKGSTAEPLREHEYEYSSREVSPAGLLLRQIVDGHRMFLLHNGASLSRLFYKLGRQKFCGLLERFWNRFALNWDVLLHGNPAVEIYGGLKLAAGGELGMGVGEEEWGSGEREVLEDFARRTDGLVDLMVSRFGEPSKAQDEKLRQGLFSQKQAAQATKEMEMWLGAGNHAQVGDGLVFSGVGAVSRASLRDVSRWAQDIYAYGESAYGVGIHPSNDRRKRRRRKSPTPEPVKEAVVQSKPKRRASPKPDMPPGIPPPIVSAAERSLERAISSHDVRKAQARAEGEETDESGWTKYLTLGYGTAWGGQRSTSPFKREESAPLSDSTEPEQASAMRRVQPEPDIDPEVALEERFRTQIRLEENGHFLIGLKGELTDDSHLESDDEDEDGEWNQRTILRTLYLEVTNKDREPELDVSPLIETPRSFSTPQYGPKFSRLRVIVYVHRPFIYTFLFNPRTESLSLPGFYRNVHTFFAPLHKPLSASTAPARVAARIAAAAKADALPSTAQVKDTNVQQPIFDLVYDPRNYTIHASIPNIPMPGSLAAEGLSIAPGGSILPEGWSRAEALNVHSAILEIIRTTRKMPGVIGEGGERELERSVKTGRGWWVVWMRLDDEAHLKKPGDGSERSQSPSAAMAKDPDITPTEASQTVVEDRAPTPEAKPQLVKDYFAGASPSQLPMTREDSPDTDASIAILADSREAILVRRARDASPSKKNASTGGGIWTLGIGGSGSSGDASGKDAASGWGPARLAEGVGVDARKYVESLLSLNR